MGKRLGVSEVVFANQETCVTNCHYNASKTVSWNQQEFEETVSVLYDNFMVLHSFACMILRVVWLSHRLANSPRCIFGNGIGICTVDPFEMLTGIKHIKSGMNNFQLPFLRILYFM